MSFTDDDIKRLKAEIPEEDYCHQICIHCGYNVKALLARLEAAEAVCEEYENSFHPAQGTPGIIKAWKKLKGVQG